jgi:hypothetical protein
MVPQITTGPIFISSFTFEPLYPENKIKPKIAKKKNTPKIIH